MIVIPAKRLRPQPGAREPGPTKHGIAVGPEAGIDGSRLSLRSAGMTLEDLNVP
jgi:hypothetical protein